MIEFTHGEMFLLFWSIAATVAAYEYRKKSKLCERMLIAAAHFTKRLVKDDALRNELRDMFKQNDDAEVKFGVE